MTLINSHCVPVEVISRILHCHKNLEGLVRRIFPSVPPPTFGTITHSHTHTHTYTRTHTRRDRDDSVALSVAGVMAVAVVLVVPMQWQRRTVQIAYPQRGEDASVFLRDSVCVRVFVRVFVSL